MDKLKYFLIGFSIPIVIQPLCEYIVNVTGALQELAVMYISKKATILQKEMREIVGEDVPETNTSCVGFQIPTEDEYEYEDDDVDD